MRALNSAATGMSAQQLKIDVISNNLANVNTTSYKKARVAFQDLYYSDVRPAGVGGQGENNSPLGLQVGNGVRAVGVEKVFTEGSVEATGQPLNMAIQGGGFFQVMNTDGDTLYTRDGSFMQNGDGEIVTSLGYLLQPGFNIPSDTTGITISEDGAVSITAGTDPEPIDLGNIELATFMNTGGLESAGGNYYRATDSSGAAFEVLPGEEGTGRLLQGHLETSNVDVAQELVSMIKAQRAYETASKAITAADEMLGQANQLKK